MEAAVEVVIGVDAHKRTHTLVACRRTRTRARDQAPSRRQRPSISQRSRGRGGGQRRRWAIEDCRHLTRRAGGRSAPRRRAGLPRPDAVDGRRAPQRSRARQVRRQSMRSRSPARPGANRASPGRRLDGPPRELRLLVDHRDDLVAERTRLQNRIRWHLHELDPTLETPAAALAAPARHRPPRRPARRSRRAHRSIARELLDRVRELNRRANELERDISAGHRARPDAARDPGLRRADRRQARRRDRRRAPLPLKDTPTLAGTAPPRNPRSSGNHHPLPSQPRRQPPSQRRVASHRAHPGTRLATRTRLHRPDASDTATPRPKRYASSDAGSPTSSTAPCSSTSAPPNPN